MNIFPHFSLALESKQGLSLTWSAFLEAIKNEPTCNIRDQVINHQIKFDIKNDSISYYNSFLPTVKIDFYDKKVGVGIVVNFQLRMPIRIMLCFYTGAILIAEITFLNMFFSNELASPLYLILPLFFALFMFTMSYFGLRLSSKSVKDHLISIIKTGDGFA